MVREYVRALPEGSVVVSGGAEGVDRVAVKEAAVLGLSFVEILPNIGTSFLIRNVRMDVGSRERLLHRNTLIAIACTRMVAFPDGSAGGTWDAVRQAKRFKRPVKIMSVRARVVESQLSIEDFSEESLVDDKDELIELLENTASPEECHARKEAAKRFLIKYTNLRDVHTENVRLRAAVAAGVLLRQALNGNELTKRQEAAVEDFMDTARAATPEEVDGE
jgi:predicted Rossmann fold nucleotide-binding protein DprA/Smf involved in DNA uptake